MSEIKNEVIKLNIQRLFIQEEHLENSDIYTVDLLKRLLIMEVSEILEIAKRVKKKVSSKTIPQFSNYDNATKRMLEVLEFCEGHEPDFLKMGNYLDRRNKKDGAHTKYGENHSKFADLLGIAFINSDKKIFITKLGRLMNELKEEEKDLILIKLLMKIPIIIEILKEAENKSVDPLKILECYLSKSTAIRRRTNILYLLKKIKGISDDSLEPIFSNIMGV